MNKPDKKFNPRKTTQISAVKDLLAKSKSVAVVDYKGMSVAQSTQLRREVRKAGGEMMITKNTLFKIASGNKDLKLEGLSAFIFALSDEITPLKALADFAKKNTILAFKMGLLGDRIMNASEISALALTPSKETSLGKVMYLLNYHTSKLVRTLDAIAKKGVN